MKKIIILIAFFSFALLMIFGMTVNAASNYYLIKEQMQKVLEEKCGARRENHSSVYIDGKYYVTDTIEASHGLCVKNTFTSSTDFQSGLTWTFDLKDYEAYDQILGLV